nr:hypothetical protein Iba_chr10eCG11970 [Ipomoea batatas]
MYAPTTLAILSAKICRQKIVDLDPKLRRVSLKLPIQKSVCENEQLLLQFYYRSADLTQRDLVDNPWSEDQILHPFKGFSHSNDFCFLGLVLTFPWDLLGNLEGSFAVFEDTSYVYPVMGGVKGNINIELDPFKRWLGPFSILDIAWITNVLH